MFSPLLCASGQARRQSSDGGDSLPLCRALFVFVSLTSVLNSDCSEQLTVDVLSDNDSVDDDSVEKALWATPPPTVDSTTPLTTLLTPRLTHPCLTMRLPSPWGIAPTLPTLAPS